MGTHYFSSGRRLTAESLLFVLLFTFRFRFVQRECPGGKLWLLPVQDFQSFTFQFFGMRPFAGATATSEYTWTILFAKASRLAPPHSPIECLYCLSIDSKYGLDIG